MGQLTRNPNLMFAEVSDSSHLKSQSSEDELVGERPEWWWTGPKPKVGMPGVRKDGTLFSLPMPNQSNYTRQSVLEYFDNTWVITETLFSSLQGEAAFLRSPYHNLRHPMVFYYVHPVALYINKFIVAKLLDAPLSEDGYYEQIFETGVDEMSWDDLSKNEMEWPCIRDCAEYRRKGYQVIRKIIETHPELDGREITMDHQLWALFLAFEHERIHIETSSVLLRELPLPLLQRPAAWPAVHSSAFSSSARNPAEGEDFPKNEFLNVTEGVAKLGKPRDYPSFGWDNEYGHKEVAVPAFKATKFLISNGEFWHFVSSGGYRNKEYWTQDGWAWKTFRNVKWPTFWVAVGPAGSHQYKLRCLFEVVDMPWSWPVDVNFYEAQAFALWQGMKLGRKFNIQTEAQYHRIRDISTYDQLKPDNYGTELVITKSGYDLEKDNVANFGLAFGSPTPVNQFPPNSEGFHDIFGNVWEYCRETVTALPGFEVHPFYEDFTTPCIDGKHYLIFGGSFVSCGDQASQFARYHFRPHFFQHLGFRLVEETSEYENASGESQEKYETTKLLNMYLDLHFGQPDETFPYSSGVLADLRLQACQFPRRCAQVLLKHCTASSTPLGCALDLGCAVGASALELSKSFERVIGIDLSDRLISAAKRIIQEKSLPYSVKTEGELTAERTARLPVDANPERVSFEVGDATNLRKDLGQFDAVLMGNLLCRLSDPAATLRSLTQIVRPGGVVLLTTPFSWFEQYTHKAKWLGGYKGASGEAALSVDGLKQVMEDQFELLEETNIPLIIREHSRKFELILPLLTVWKRK